MKVFAIGDLHLGHAVDKPMDIFGPQWRDHAARMADSWTERVGAEDLVLVPGDLSWAMRMEQAEEDLRWMERLPGTKVLIKGNHDYWWPSISRLRERLRDTTLVPLQYDSVTIGGVAVGGTRLWTVPELAGDYADPLDITPEGEAASGPGAPQPAQQEKIFRREMGRLASALSGLDPGAPVRIAMTHFPPTDERGRETVVTRLLEEHRVDLCVFGHLHSLGLPPGRTWDFERNGIRYVLASCDSIDFTPYFLLET